MIRFAAKKDIYQLKKLWISSFYDSEAYTDFFFENIVDTECIVYEQPKTGNIISMLFLLKCSLHGYNGRYIFAACTQADYRGKGIMSQLLTFTIHHFEHIDDCDFLCLVPANKTLFQYYANNGFKTYFYNTILTLENNKKIHSNNNIAIPFETFASIRSGKGDTVQWTSPLNEFVFKENLFNGGKNLKTPTGYVIMREYADVCNVIEWHSLTYDENELFMLTSCSMIEARKPCSDEFSKCPNGMIKLLNDRLKNDFSKIKYPYLSLVLD